MEDYHIIFSLLMFQSHACDSFLICLLSPTFRERTQTAVAAQQSEPTGSRGPAGPRPANPTVLALTNKPCAVPAVSYTLFLHAGFIF